MDSIQDLIVYVIIAIAVIVAGVRMYQGIAGKKSGCDGCASDCSGCSIADLKDKVESRNNNKS